MQSSQVCVNFVKIIDPLYFQFSLQHFPFPNCTVPIFISIEIQRKTDFLISDADL